MKARGLSLTLIGCALLAMAALGRSASAQAGDVCSVDDPANCSSCRTLAGATAKLEGKDLSAGREIDGVLWSPLFMAYYLNCQDVGRSLVRRGADVNWGGRGGAMLAEVATQRALNPDSKNYTTNVAWAGILEGGLIDLDARQAGGPSNRQVWADPPPASRQRHADLWARFERRSVSTPQSPAGPEFDSDTPTAATGRTRPSESAVSKGVEKFTKVYPRSGMAGLSAEIAGCYKWALQIAKPAGRRLALEHCAALDIVSRNFDASTTSRMNFPPSEFFQASRFDNRLNQIRDQAFDGLVWPVYRRNLEASAMHWFDFHVEVVLSRDASTSAGTSPDPQALLSQWYELNGQCRGGPGNEPRTMDACRRRGVVGDQLGQAGYCYGRRGEYGYQMSWHVCGPNSIRN